MQSATRFIARVLAKRPTQIRTITSFQRSAINSSRCVCSCKILQKYQTNVHNTSFSRYMETLQTSDHERETDETIELKTHLEVANVPFGTSMEQIKEFFENVELLEEPKFILTKTGLQTGMLVLKPNSFEKALELNETMFNGRPIRVKEITEARANALVGKTVIKVSNMPYDWNTSDIYEFLYTQGVGKIMQLIVPPSVVYGSHSSGRAYVAFYTEQDRDEAANLLSGVIAGKRPMRVEGTTLVDGFHDRSRSKRRATENVENY